MIKRTELENYLNLFLSCASFSDYAPNGLQIEGSEDIQSICTAVTASLDVIEVAIKEKASALIVHHGYFWRGEDPRIIGMKHKRIESLLASGISLFAYHLPLDCHLELGNNVCIAKILNLESVYSIKAQATPNLLWFGEFAEPLSADNLSNKLSKSFRSKPQVVTANSKPIKKLAWCSGAAQDLIETAKLEGADAYLSGEISERTYYQAKELGISYFACGHHATERFGIQALGEHLAQKFALNHQFIDSDNPV